MAEELGVEGASTLRKQDLMFAILKEEAENGEEIIGEGTIEVLPDGFGFLRSPRIQLSRRPRRHLCLAQHGPQVRPAHRRHGGRRNSRAQGWRTLFRADQGIKSINFDDPDVVRHRVNFDNLTPLYPDEKLNARHARPDVKDKSARVIDIVSPQGKGQRALIVAPPRTGKTVLLQNIAKAITDNHPGSVPDRPADRRTPRRSHRHAAQREG
jgi:transcription termination factor Rho